MPIKPQAKRADFLLGCSSIATSLETNQVLIRERPDQGP